MISSLAFTADVHIIARIHSTRLSATAVAGLRSVGGKYSHFWGRNGFGRRIPISRF